MTRHRLDSNDFVRYLNIYFHLRKLLRKEKNNITMKPGRYFKNNAALPLGWNILDTNRTTGGLLGYSSLNCMVSLNVPSSNGVSLGLQWSVRVCVCVCVQNVNKYTLHVSVRHLRT